jgi:WD40-like Beta Propeller Repeat
VDAPRRRDDHRSADPGVLAAIDITVPPVRIGSRTARPVSPRDASAPPPGFAIAAAAAAPVGRELALVRRDDARGRSEVVVLDLRPAARRSVRGAGGGRPGAVPDGRLRERPLFAGPGRFGAPAWSPDGRSLLVPWSDADQWLFLRARAGGRPTAVADVAAQFMPGAASAVFPTSVEWCCASAGP